MRKNIAGVDTHYQIIGHAKKVLILLHGWGCDWQIWAPVIPELSKHFQLIIPDLPAFGQSATPAEVWSSFDYSRWLANFIKDTVGTQPFSLGGHSFGGKIAAVYGAAQSQLSTEVGLTNLVIIDASGLPLALTPREQLVQSFSQLLPHGIKERLGRPLKAKVLQQLGVASDYQHANDYQQQVLKKIVRENIEEQLAQITTPTLVVWGANDDTTPLEKGRTFANHIPGANLLIMADSGHYPFVDETQKFVREITAFL